MYAAKPVTAGSTQYWGESERTPRLVSDCEFRGVGMTTKTFSQEGTWEDTKHVDVVGN